MIDFKLPSLGADMDEGRLLEWKVAPGDVVTKGLRYTAKTFTTYRYNGFADFFSGFFSSSILFFCLS